MLPSPAPLRHNQSRRYLWQGLTLLAVGSTLLLCCKFSVSAWLHSVLLVCGGGAILLGNGFMLYGLLHHADDRVYVDEQSALHEQADVTPPSHSTAPAEQDTTSKPSPQPAKHECG